MRKIALALPFLLIFLSALSAQQNPSITIVNNTGYTVWYVYISQTASDSWGSDRLSSNETLDNGQAVSLQLPYPISVVNRYDIKLEDSDGDSYTKMNVLVSANSRIVFTMDDFVSQTPQPPLEGPQITIVNNTGNTVYYVYISQTASDSWGSDRLSNDETLGSGQTVSLQLPYLISVVNRYDMRLKDSDGRTYTKMNVLVSANSRIVFTKSDMD
jgi:hypothetical protein